MKRARSNLSVVENSGKRLADKHEICALSALYVFQIPATGLFDAAGAWRVTIHKN